MKNLKGELSLLWMLIVVWVLSIVFSTIMFTIALMHSVVESIFVSGLTGVFATIGVLYTGAMIIKIKNKIKLMEKENNA